MGTLAKTPETITTPILLSGKKESCYDWPFSHNLNTDQLYFLKLEEIEQIIFYGY